MSPTKCPWCDKDHMDFVKYGRHWCPTTMIWYTPKPMAPLDATRLITNPTLNLPTDDQDRKDLPIFDGVLMYFPNAIAAIAEVSRMGNEQHNPGEPLHWARGKSMDQYNTAIRHMMDHRMGQRYNGRARHLANAAWRILAALQLDIEEEARDARRESESLDRQAIEATSGVLPEAGTERDGLPRARLSRVSPRVRLRNRGKGARKKAHT